MRECSICGRGSQVKTVYKKLRGHFNPTSKKRAYPNLQWALLPSSQKRVKACSSCIKTLYKAA